jgi:hypothetical protein
MTQNFRLFRIYSTLERKKAFALAPPLRSTVLCITDSKFMFSQVCDYENYVVTYIFQLFRWLRSMNHMQFIHGFFP